VVDAIRKAPFPIAGVAASAEVADLRRLRVSLRPARGVDRYNREKSRASGPAKLSVATDLSPIDGIADALGRERLQISTRQRAGNDRAKADFNQLATLFICAVITYEIFAKFFHDNGLWLAAYLVLLNSIIGLALWGRWNRREAVAEDYRAVAEMLRVQRAWCSAGLTARVDREHLQGVDPDLTPIRICATTIIGWISLRHGFQPNGTRDWSHVRGSSAQPRTELRAQKKPPPDWVGSQLWYFATNGEDREGRAALIDTESWCLFAASAALGFELWVWLLFPRIASAYVSASRIRLPHLPNVIGYDVSFIFWGVLAFALIKLRGLNRDWREGAGAVVLTALCGVLTAICLGLAFANAGPVIAELTHSVEPENPDPYHHAVTNAVIGGLVSLYAFAGAMRYRMEKLNIEAEALDYRDALRRFERAERRLADGWDSTKKAPADEKAAQRIVFELGRLALEENESWLKSRRERPLTPIVG
jgi:hypothetical protein